MEGQVLPAHLHFREDVAAPLEHVSTQETFCITGGRAVWMARGCPGASGAQREGTGTIAAHAVWGGWSHTFTAAPTQPLQRRAWEPSVAAATAHSSERWPRPGWAEVWQVRSCTQPRNSRGRGRPEAAWHPARSKPTRPGSASRS